MNIPSALQPTTSGPQSWKTAGREGRISIYGKACVLEKD